MDESTHEPVGLPMTPAGAGGAPVLPTMAEGIQEPGDPKAVLALLQTWRSDDSGYDEAVWPRLKAALECERQGSRCLFDD